ncbi:MAG: hydrogenase expression/formation protein HypE [Anaerolineae bacterium]|uniref:hydrogenase expression/formation protein HypE n=1 Tax=Promineifilum sp. TaxID=2664178 RepID=UPI001DB06E50|nr:hydrogenase expression/formation protein HypE [Anaerolineales bacterium]MCB8934151.1 hydrogenase expression/formation protein HypE [Promineifilum sp.]MCW5845667.1 hydrogenase expression/formation protein HypE [Anaerolineae bacterium]
MPLRHDEKIVLGHGSGGRMSHDLIGRLFQRPFDNPALRAANDAGVVAVPPGRLAVSTDSHVVTPLFFPGGDIGRLAICGTVNDLAMMGATPLYLTAGFILEEGLDVAVLARVVESMQVAAAEAGVQIIAGDTKVVQRGKADGLYINTAGVGVISHDREIGGALAQPGDVIILSGPMGDHGIAVLAARGELGFAADVISDVAPLNHLVAELIAADDSPASDGIRVLRDPTRGGVATTLNEIARQSNVALILDERVLPVRPPVAAACEMLGFDPLYIANEGKLLAIVAEEEAQKVLATMRATRYGEEATIIGRVQAAPEGRVLLRTSIGSTRVVDMLAGEILPRIC